MLQGEDAELGEAAEDGTNLTVNEEAMLLAQMQAIQAMQALTRWRVHDCSTYPINPKCDRIDSAPMRKLLDTWTQFREQRQKLHKWATGICTGACHDAVLSSNHVYISRLFPFTRLNVPPDGFRSKS